MWTVKIIHLTILKQPINLKQYHIQAEMSCVNELDNAITIITHFIANYRWFLYYISEGISWAFWASGSYEFVQKILHKWNCKVLHFIDFICWEKIWCFCFATIRLRYVVQLQLLLPLLPSMFKLSKSRDPGREHYTFRFPNCQAYHNNPGKEWW